MSVLLDVHDLSISFGGLHAVDNFHISIKKGQLYGLIGPNGAGKTTVFNLLTGVYKPDEGVITLDGTKITGLKTIEINKAGIARTFQNIRLFKKMTVIENVKTAHVQGNTDKSDVGYYFPEPVSLTAVKEQRTEWEKDMWAAGADAYITENFAKLWLNHGVHPDNAKYAYVVLPGMTAQEVSEYKPDFEILSQDNTAHAVRNTRLSVAGYNFWQKTGGSVGGVSVSGQLILMTHDENGVFDISVSDPTFKATKPIVVTFADVNAESIISADSNVTVIDTKPLKISVNLKDINGRKITLSAAKEKTGNQ